MGKLSFIRSSLRKRQLIALLFINVIFLPFQNCAPAPQAEQSSRSENGTSNSSNNLRTGSSSSSSAATRSGSSSNSGLSSGAIRSGSSTSSASGSTREGSSTSDTNTRNPGSTTSPSDPRPGGTTTPGSSGSGGTVTAGALSVTVNISSLNISENDTGTIKAEVKGGSGTYTTTWYKNGVALDPSKSISNGLFISGNEIQISVGNYISSTNEGSYKIVVKDNALTATSISVQVKMVPNNKSCPSQNYYTFYAYNTGSAADYQVASNMMSFAQIPISQLFNNEHGNFLLPANFNHLEKTVASELDAKIASANVLPQIINIFHQAPQYAPIQFQRLAIGATSNLGRRTIACSFNLFLPSLYNKTLNPNISWSDYRLQSCISPLSSGWGCGSFNFFNQDQPIYKLEGTMDLECRGNKYKIISNTCRLVIEQPDSSGGSF